MSTALLNRNWLKRDISDDGLTYTFNLRKGVKWHHDYGEFTSEDVKFTLERHADPEVGSINAENIHLDNIGFDRYAG